MITLDASDLTGPPPLAGFGRLALFLDLDGTLAAIQPLPQDVKPEAWRTHLLRQLGLRLDGRVAVISGRTLDEVDSILEGSVAAVAAVHGLVRREPDGRIVSTPPSPAVLGAARDAEGLVDRLPGLRLERKGPSIALHYRQAPALAARVADAAQILAERWDLRLQPGDMVVELCTPGHDKGSAILDFMREAPFAGCVPLFLGDDLTDEVGFRAVSALGGLGVLVAARRRTAARAWLPSVDAVRAWLEQGLDEPRTQ